MPFSTGNKASCQLLPTEKGATHYPSTAGLCAYLGNLCPFYVLTVPTLQRSIIFSCVTMFYDYKNIIALSTPFVNAFPSFLENCTNRCLRSESYICAFCIFWNIIFPPYMSQYTAESLCNYLCPQRGRTVFFSQIVNTAPLC